MVEARRLRAAHEQEIVEDDVCRATLSNWAAWRARRGLDGQGPDDHEPSASRGHWRTHVEFAHCTHGGPRLANLLVKQAGDRVHAHFKVAAGGFSALIQSCLGALGTSCHAISGSCTHRWCARLMLWDDRTASSRPSDREGALTPR